MTYKGTIIKILETHRISEKFCKREVVVSDKTDKYPQQVIFETQNSNCGLLDGVREGDEVTINFSIRGKEWKSPKDGSIKYFITLVASDILRASYDPNQPYPDQTASSYNKNTNDDLPF